MCLASEELKTPQQVDHLTLQQKEHLTGLRLWNHGSRRAAQTVSKNEFDIYWPLSG
jgi:hypothetical protein